MVSRPLRRLLHPSPLRSQNVRVHRQFISSTAPLSKKQNSIPAAYYRGGTSRAVFFRKEDLPSEQQQWDDIFRGTIGSPDPYGRQLDGMGGGISSLSKVCVVSKSDRPDADVEYTFVSLGVKNMDVDYSSNCGNMISAGAICSRYWSLPRG